MVKLIRNFLFPIIILVFVGKADTLTWVLGGFLGLGLLQAVIKYITFTYRIENGELITRQGIIERTERHIPLTRVQDLRVEQGIVHRVLGVVDVHVETAGGRGAEASLSVLSRDEAENLRRAVFEQVQALTATPGTTLSPPADSIPAEVVKRLSTRELILAGLTSNRLASAVAVLAVAWQLLDDILPKNVYERFGAVIGSTVEQWVDAGGHPNWIGITMIALALIVGGTLFSAAGSVMLFHGFTLSRRGEDLRRVYGLFTKRSSSLPRRRIQVLKIEETWLRRLFGLAALRADTAGSRPADQQQNQDGRDVLLPVVRHAELEPLLSTFLPTLERDPLEWRQVSRRAIRRGTLKGAVVCILVAGALAVVERHWLGLWPIAFIPIVYVLNVASYRHLGYSLGDRFFRTRRGWLSRDTHIVPIRNVQAIVLTQTPFDRRHGVMTLLVDTAGQAYTGGGPRIRNVAIAAAETVARTLAHRASQTRYRW